MENTIPSITEAFKDGADLVEFDIHPTTDGSWAVFHDWVLDCRTNGQGVTRNHALAYLKTLDVGYGYTADGGKTFPLRGQGVGLMPSLDEVLSAFPNGSFLIHIKSNDPREGEALVTKLKTLPNSTLRNLMVYGGNRPVSIVRSKMPDLRTVCLKMEKNCLVTYAALGWTGYIPTDCRNSLLIVPANIAPWLWGWPNRFLRRMINVGTEVFVADDLKSGGLKGLNGPEDLRKLPKGYSGGIWTDQIDVVGPALRGRR
jgi:glycerophosphoryl diester phosphodiesterase